jgi:hypothetical protein
MGNIGTKQSSWNIPHGYTFVPQDFIIIVVVTVAVDCGVTTVVVTPGSGRGEIPVAVTPEPSDVDKGPLGVVWPKLVAAGKVNVLVYV